MESKPDPKGRPLGTRTTIDEILDEEFLDSSSLDDDDMDSEDDSCPQTDIKVDRNGRASYNARGGTEDPIKNSDSKAGETTPDVERQKGTLTSAPSFEKAKPLSALWTLSRMQYETEKAHTEAFSRLGFIPKREIWSIQI